MNSFVDRDIFMRFRGGGVGHQVTREWDEFLRHDGAVVSVDDDEDLEFEVGDDDDDDDEHGEDDADDDEDDEDDGDNDNDGEDGREEGIDDEDQIRADEGEELDDDILAQEGYGAL
jgi:hypothetical protein